MTKMWSLLKVLLRIKNWITCFTKLFFWWFKLFNRFGFFLWFAWWNYYFSFIYFLRCWFSSYSNILLLSIRFNLLNCIEFGSRSDSQWWFKILAIFLRGLYFSWVQSADLFFNFVLSGGMNNDINRNRSKSFLKLVKWNLAVSIKIESSHYVR